MLRLACFVVAGWIGVVFVLLGITIPARGLPRRHFSAAVIISGLVLVAGWGASNPASIVALTNLHRSAHGRPFDVGQAASLGADAVPALLHNLGDLSSAEVASLRFTICSRSQAGNDGTAFNLSHSSADAAQAEDCH